MVNMAGVASLIITGKSVTHSISAYGCIFSMFVVAMSGGRDRFRGGEIFTTIGVHL